MDDRDLARSYAFVRLALGGGFLVLPRFVLRQWAGAATASSPGAASVGRALGVRDALLGAGILRALDEPAGAGRWLRFAAVADAVDAVAVLVSYRQLPARRRFLAFVAGCCGAAAGVALAQRLRD